MILIFIYVAANIGFSVEFNNGQACNNQAAELRKTYPQADVRCVGKGMW